LIKQYIGIVLRWAWLLILATVVASAVAFVAIKRQPPLYQASARLIVGPGIEGVNPDLNALRAAAQLMRTYAEFATSQPVLNKVIDELHLPITTDNLATQIKVNSDETTLLLTISTQGSNPVQTVAIVSSLTHQLIGMSPSSTDGPQSQIKVRISDQIQKTEKDASDAETQIKQYEAKIQTALQNGADAETRRFLADQLAQQRAYLTEARRTSASLYASLQTSFTNQIKIVELDTAPMPVDNNLKLIVLLAGVAGLLLAVTIVFAFEYFNDMIRTTADLLGATDIPLLGAIAKHKPLRGKVHEQLIVQALPGSRAAENYRMLGSKLLLSGYTTQYKNERRSNEDANMRAADSTNMNTDHQLRSVVLSGVQTNEDTSEITANLAVVLAQTGHRVILVDAYLHRPTISHQFGIVDDEGLTSVLAGWVQQAKVTPVEWAPNLSILPSGPIPPNPFELLVSARMATLIKELESQADIVLVATSPLLSFADSLILASRVDGVVVLLRSGTATRDMVHDTVESLHSLNARIIGTIYDYNRPAHKSSPTRQDPKLKMPLQRVSPAKNTPAFLKSAKL
jgi:succinoglycan biosynthesis transport protein ExoP